LNAPQPFSFFQYRNPIFKLAYIARLRRRLNSCVSEKTYACKTNLIDPPLAHRQRR
jgi:hypothetical protein